MLIATAYLNHDTVSHGTSQLRAYVLRSWYCTLRRQMIRAKGVAPMTCSLRRHRCEEVHPCSASSLGARSVRTARSVEVVHTGTLQEVNTHRVCRRASPGLVATAQFAIRYGMTTSMQSDKSKRSDPIANHTARDRSRHRVIGR